jgi:DnaJ-class molecular chaperone
MADRRDKPLIDWYAQLDVRPDASPREIATAYRRLARALHPDSAQSHAVDVQRLQLVIEAHAVLSNPTRRRDYDERRGIRRSGRSSTDRMPCPVCRGARTIAAPCGQCRGTGHHGSLSAWLGTTSVCRACRGTGWRPVRCGACGATGYTNRSTKARMSFE